MANLPLLYTFRRCPYAIRTRMVLCRLGINCITREVKLAEKPTAFLRLAPKATVPVLCLSNGAVIDESLDIIRWALTTYPQESALSIVDLDHELLALNDTQFKFHLDRYKYPQRYDGASEADHFNECLVFLKHWQQLLEERAAAENLRSGGSMSLLEITVFPFVRQCYFVQPSVLQDRALDTLLEWLHAGLQSNEFLQVMQKQPFWYEEGDQEGVLLRDASSTLGIAID